MGGDEVRAESTTTVIRMSRRDQPPIYLRIAAELREQIERKALLPNQPLPPETALAAEFGVTRRTIRHALDELRREGRIVTTHGRGSAVQSEHAVRELHMDRYHGEVRRVAAGAAPVVPPRNTATVEVQRIPADQFVARGLRVEEGEPVLHRQLVHKFMQVPQTLSNTYYRLDLAEGTPLDTDRTGVEGGIGMLAAIGVRVTAIEEWKAARMPDADERDKLRIVGTVPVMAVTRWMYAGDRVVEFARDVVFPGDRAAFVDRIDLSADWA